MSAEYDTLDAAISRGRLASHAFNGPTAHCTRCGVSKLFVLERNVGCRTVIDYGLNDDNGKSN